MENEFQDFDNNNQNELNNNFEQPEQNQGYQNYQKNQNYQNNGYNNMNGGGQGGYYSNEPATETPCGMAIAGMVLGILSIVCCCIWYVSGILAILALIFSIITIVKKKTGRGMAIAGIICGSIGLIMAIILLICFIGFSNTMTVEDYKELIKRLEEME